VGGELGGFFEDALDSWGFSVEHWEGHVGRTCLYNKLVNT